MAAKLLSLPEHAFATILEYALDGFRQEVVGPDAPHFPFLVLKDIALLSKHSNELVNSIIKRLKSGASCFELEDNGMIDDDYMVEIIDEAQEYGATVRDFRLRLGDYDQSSLSPSPGPGELDDVNIDWDRLFGYMPAIKRLDLTKVPLLSRHLPQILVAASTRCRHLEYLILPGKSDYHSTVQGAEIENVMTTLIKALETWHVNGTCRGLKQLTVPARTEEDHFRASAQYIQAVVQFCPKIQYLDGYQRRVFFGSPHCEEMWFLTMETWEAFNASCTALRTFDWGVVPFADPYFEIFGNHVKPQLKSLSLTANSKWNYLYFFHHYTGQADFPEPDFVGERTGYGSRAGNARAVLRACPFLSELRVEMDFFTNNEKPDPYVDTDVYGDSFWEAVATHCPLVEEIMVVDVSGRERVKVRPFETLTDRSLLTLAGLKRLSECYLPPARLTGNGIFAYLRRVSETEGLVGEERLLIIAVGGKQRKKVASFYKVILDLLKLLSETREEDLGAALCRTKTELHVDNPYHWKAESSWSEEYMREELLPLLQLVKRKHPSLAVEVDILGRNGDRFDRIRRLILDWRPRYRGRPLFHDMTDDY